jgi:hypothetical protein
MRDRVEAIVCVWKMFTPMPLMADSFPTVCSWSKARAGMT